VVETPPEEQPATTALAPAWDAASAAVTSELLPLSDRTPKGAQADSAVAPAQKHLAEPVQRVESAQPDSAERAQGVQQALVCSQAQRSVRLVELQPPALFQAEEFPAARSSAELPLAAPDSQAASCL